MSRGNLEKYDVKIIVVIIAAHQETLRRGLPISYKSIVQEGGGIAMESRLTIVYV